jgi:hypothetical protein
MKNLFIFASVLLLSSCYKDPISSETKRNEIQVEFLFEHDGIKMYRFNDGGRYHYFTSRGETISNQHEGKSDYQENIQ